MKKLFTILSCLLLLAMSAIILPSCSSEREMVLVKSAGSIHEVYDLQTGHTKTLDLNTMDVLTAVPGDTLIYSEWSGMTNPTGYKKYQVPESKEGGYPHMLTRCVVWGTLEWVPIRYDQEVKEGDSIRVNNNRRVVVAIRNL